MSEIDEADQLLREAVEAHRTRIDDACQAAAISAKAFVQSNGIDATYGRAFRKTSDSTPGRSPIFAITTMRILWQVRREKH
jgi:hypothetical protein